MIRFRKPELVPTIVVILTAGLMFKLGYWQIERLEWKTQLLAHIEAIQSEPPKDLLSYPVKDLPDKEWHNITVHGRLLNDKEMYATPRYYQGQMGYAILTPMQVGDAAHPEYVLVNRGWVPPQKKYPASRAAGNVTGPVVVEGVVRGHLKQEWMRPDNVPQKNLWFWYDLPAMARYTGLPLLPVMIDATRITQGDGAPVTQGPTPFPLEINIRNDHLGYAITWFAIGFIAIVMYGCYYRESGNKPIEI